MAELKPCELREHLEQTILTQVKSGATTIRKEYTQVSGSARHRKVMI